MSSKILSLKRVMGLVRPHTVTLIGSSFCPFNRYYQRLLLWASKKSRPLIAIVQTDYIVKIRRGFGSSLEYANIRASRIAALPFVDYVVVAARQAHDPKLIKLLSPRFVILQRDHPRYLENLIQELKRRFCPL